MDTLSGLMGTLTPDAGEVTVGRTSTSSPELNEGPVAVTGYCFGGRLGWIIAAAGSGGCAWGWGPGCHETRL